MPKNIRLILAGFLSINLLVIIVLLIIVLLLLWLVVARVWIVSVTIVYHVSIYHCYKLLYFTLANDKIVHFLFQFNLFMVRVLTRNRSQKITGLSFNSQKRPEIARQINQSWCDLTLERLGDGKKQANPPWMFSQT